MSLIAETTAERFDTSAIHRGDLIRAKYKSWDAPCNGIVAYAKPDEIRVLYLTVTGYVSNFYAIHLADVLSGLWEIQWGGSFEDVSSYTPEPEGNGQEGTESDSDRREGTEPDNSGIGETGEEANAEP